MVRYFNRLIIVLLLFLFNCLGGKLNEYEGSLDHFLKCEEYFKDQKYSRAKEEFNLWFANAGLSEKLSEAQFYVAECDYNLGAFSNALIEYDKYLNMPNQNSVLSKKAELMICRCYYNLSQDSNKDQTDTEKALENLQYYIEKKSMKNHADEINNMIVDLRTKLAKKEFETAKLYIRIEEYKAAEIYFENIINEYYDTDFFDNSVFNLSLLQFVNGKDSSIKLFESNKDSFINFDNYNQWFEILNTLNENEEISYYVKQIK